MFRSAFFAVAVLAAVPAFAETSGPVVPETAAQVTLSYAPVVKRAAPAVVNIYAKRVVEARNSPFANDPFFGNLFRDRGRSAPQVQNALGSGVIVAESGLVVTNFHVAGQADEIRVVLNDRREYDAKVLLADEESDIAVLQMSEARDLPVLALRDSDTIEVGDLVLAIGNPFGIGQTVSSGIVSGLARSGVSVGSGRGYFIQTDAAINPGNSGGALVDMQGRLVGINTAILTRSGGSNGIGFAIPANLVQRFVEQAQQGRSSFERPWAGVGGQAVDAALAEGLGMGLPEGVVLTELHPDSPFRKAGLAVGDVVLQLGGTPVNTPQEMIFRMSAVGVGGEIEVQYLSGGTRHSTRVAMIAPPETPPRAAYTVRGKSPLAGLTAVQVNPAVASEYNLSGTETGVMITDPGEVAARIGLQAGDVLLQVNDTRIDKPADLKAASRWDGRTWQIEYLRGGTRGVLRFRL